MLPLVVFGLRAIIGAYAANVEDDETVVEDEQFQEGLPGGRMPSPDELLKILETMDTLPENEKEEIRRSILAQKGGAAGPAVDDEGHLATSFFASQLFILLCMLAILALIFVFFGYKLYKSLSERERKREEKKKNKQMKKKK